MASHTDQMPSDEHLAALLARCALRDQNAFAQLYRSTSARLFGVLLRILKRRDWAEDALQEAYLRVWSHAGDYLPGRAPPMAWLISIARYRAFDMLRKVARDVTSDAGSRSIEESLSDANPGHSEQLHGSQDYKALQDCLTRLQENQRQSLMLAYCEGFTHVELSSRMQAPVGTVKSWIRRGLQQLKRCLEA